MTRRSAFCDRIPAITGAASLFDSIADHIGNSGFFLVLGADLVGRPPGFWRSDWAAAVRCPDEFIADDFAHRDGLGVFGHLCDLVGVIEFVMPPVGAIQNGATFLNGTQ
jgi:hypothetical protein